MAMLYHSLGEPILDLFILMVWEESPRKLLGESFFLIIWITYWHAKHGFTESLVFFLRVGYKEVSHPLLEPDRGQAWDIWPFV